MDLSLKPCTTSTEKIDMDMDSILKPCTTAEIMDMDMDTILKPCTTTASLEERCDRPLIDRLSSLPDEMLIRILSLLPTKDAAAACVLSKRLRRVFPLITSLDFDVSPISHCATHPYKIQQFPCFVTFVDTVLSSYQSQYLTRFRLRVSTDFETTHFRGCSATACRNQCLPDLTSNHIQSWISFPFTRCGSLKELELCIYTRVSGHNLRTSCIASNARLPPAIFMCESLETLKLDVNLDLHHVYTMASFRLPNLKQLHLRASFLSEYGFVSRLVSSCPVLEDLVIEAFWNCTDCLRICSSSLRRLTFTVLCGLVETWNTGSVVIDTPNLEDLRYSDETASNQYSITNLDRVAKASIGIDDSLKVLSFIRPLSNVKHLCLNGCLNEDFSIEVMDQLPEFRNLKYLHLGFDGYVYWDIVLLAFLNRSPVLETLAFLEGLVDSNDRNYNGEAQELEQEFFRTAQVTTLECCKSHLKRIEIHYYFGHKREIDLIWFLLRHALVLEELVVLPRRSPPYETPDQKSMESTLRNLPKASINCSIQVLA